jgi:hypothetical protein
MSKGTLLLFLVLASCVPLSARLGETEAELGKRYGKIFARNPANITEQGRTYVLGETLQFRPEQWFILALLINGRCESVSISKKGEWTEEQFSVLLNGNAGRYAWREVKNPLPKFKREWIRDDGATAIWLSGSYFTVTTPIREKAIEAIKKRAKAEASKLPNF